MHTLFDTQKINKGNKPHQFKDDLSPLPETFIYKNKTIDTKTYLEDSWTTGFMVIKNNPLRFEKYFRGNTKTSTPITWSMSKSIVSALVGIAVHEGYIDDLEKAVSDYVPILKDSGYKDVSLKNVLQMSSGIRFNEDYGDFHSDINRMGRTFALSTPMDDFVVSLTSQREQGTYNHYVSMDTQVLGMVLRKTTGIPLSKYLEEKIWKKIGMESDAYWIIDSKGMEAAFGGLNVALRDYAKLGLLYLNKGQYKGEQIIPEQWIKDSVTPDSPHLLPGKRPNASWVLGYGYQWWIPQEPEGDFLAIGIYNQYTYISPKYNTVIVKFSAYPDYNTDGSHKTLQGIQLFKKIAKTM